jgi:hypothetical protein
LELDPAANNRKKVNRQLSAAPQQDIKVMLVWLERMEDSASLPIEGLMDELSTGMEVSQGVAAKDAFVIFLQPLASGLLRVKMQGPATK